ncbi:UDP-glucose/GDP-mannose dehydrogenase family protein [bacterium]|nr:MAG: UDP-glucose/GDP-mannose dehydrogenase family protein [bacterium]
MRSTMSKKICIVGTGYVGMASAIGLAELGWSVTGYDIMGERIAGLRAGITPYREAGIDEPLHRHLASGALSFVTDLAAAVRGARIVILTVGTPSSADGSADLSALNAAVEALLHVPLAPAAIVAVRSTVPVGTSDDLAARLAGRARVVYAPEFLREGSALRDFLHPDRIVVGTDSIGAATAYAALFEALDAPVLMTSRRNAELIKGVSNAFLALKISFANEIANLCDEVGADSGDVLRGVGYDRRIGGAFLAPGIGFGGPCFEKDVKSLRHVAEGAGTGYELLRAVLRVNDAQPLRVVAALERELGGLKGRTIAVWGLAFKAGTDDVRDSLALRVLEELSRRGARAVAYDPAVRSAALPQGCRIAASALEATNRADALLLLTEWPSFREIDPAALAASLRRGLVVDGRNLLDPERFAAAGLRYRGIGRSLDPAARSLAVAG